ncbi:MAG: AIR carboxylase family protein [Anaerolineae bacterium]|nr:AIR carboxylase family protein [Anaerolineae bacterium]
MVVLILGSPSDRSFAERITQALDGFGIPWQMRIASAHKTPRHLLEMLAQHEADPRPKVYITVAGRSNALSGMVDAQVAAPVIACPPYSEAFGGADVFSSLRTPSGVAPALVLEPENAALLAAKVLATADSALRARVQAAQAAQQRRIVAADAESHCP